eukprot:TRINITY_DN3063_c0_g1_i3.p1 TRINITY_DN3063_c0_g1~~TRINITY_DN3063_c0_g1_i3.p1  ORF type:complete len:368 (-),score=22.92 TRINITY_DN3063_c0_g1_i3:73-1176(-)
MNTPCGDISLGCGPGVCIEDSRCQCPPYRFGRDCTVLFSEFIGSSAFIVFEVLFITLYVFLTLVAGLMVVSILRNPRVVHIFLHKVGIFMICGSSASRLLYLIVSWAWESAAVYLIHFQRILFPVMTSVFLFQVIIWFEATRAIKTDNILNPSAILGQKRVHAIAFGFLTLIFAVQISLDGLIVYGKWNYALFNALYSFFLGALLLTIAISFWICRYIINKQIQQLREGSEYISPVSMRNKAVAPMAMSIGTLITLFFGSFSFWRDMTQRDNYLLVNIPLRMAEFGYCVVFLFSMGLPTYTNMWHSLKERLSGGSSITPSIISLEMSVNFSPSQDRDGNASSELEDSPERSHSLNSVEIEPSADNSN